MFQEFKTFAMRGNVVDMAVGIIIGAAFGGIVSSFVDGVLMPVIGLGLGGADFSNLFLVLKDGASSGPYVSLAAAEAAGAVTMAYGSFINTIINFLIVAFALFMLIKGMNAAKTQQAAAPAAPPPPSNEEKLLTDIRDLLSRK